MAKLGDLVVRIGADTKDLNKSLGRVQRNMRSMTGNVQQLGQNMTRSLTLPLAAFGAAAVKSAADLETLETSFVSLTGGVEQAGAMVKQLNEFTATTPFQLEEVAKSARQLIASGTKIEDVNEQLRFLGDIAATSGSSIDEIAAIFAKVKAKGKVELENLNQLAERGIPIFTALSEATGLPADKLGAGAVSVEEFNRVLKSFSEEGGFAAGSMERLSQTAAGKFSTALDNAKFAAADLGDVLLPVATDALDKIIDLAKGFLSMNDNAKTAIVRFGGLAAAVGPVLAFLPQIITQVRTLGVVLAANPILAAAGVIAAIGFALGDMKTEAEDATTSIEDLRDSFSELTEDSREERRQEAVDMIKQLQLYDKVAQKFRDTEQAVKDMGLKDGTAPFINTLFPMLRKVKEGLTDAELAAYDFGIEFFKMNDYLSPVVASSDRVTDAIIEQQNQMAALTVKQVEYSEATEDATEATETYGMSVEHLFNRLNAVELVSEKSKVSVNGLLGFLNKVELEPLTEQVEDLGTKATSTNDALGAMIENFSAGVQSALSDTMTFGQGVLTVVKTIIKGYLAAAKAKVVQNAIEGASGTGPAFPFVAAGLLTAGMALVDRVGMPKLAKGGLAYGPTMAMVGDNRNAAIDPEVVAPLSKLKDMMGGGVVEVVGRIKGDDIFLSNARSNNARNRYA